MKSIKRFFCNLQVITLEVYLVVLGNSVIKNKLHRLLYVESSLNRNLKLDYLARASVGLAYSCVNFSFLDNDS